MKSFVIALMLFAFLMDVGYNTPSHLSKKYEGHPWEEYQSSQDKYEADPWGNFD